jgi:hypothetical protein
MLWKPIIVQTLIFIVTLLCSRLIIALIQRCLQGKNYKLTQRFYNIIISLILVTVGIVSGKEIFYMFL